MKEQTKYKIILILFALFAGVSCNENPVGVSVNLDEEFKLKVGEQAVLQEENLKIKFVSVPEDSRCPVDAMCFLPGNAKVALKITEDITELNDTLNTHLDPKAFAFLQYYIILKNLEPYQKTDEKILPWKYVATLEVRSNIR